MNENMNSVSSTMFNLFVLSKQLADLSFAPVIWSISLHFQSHAMQFFRLRLLTFLL